MPAALSSLCRANVAILSHKLGLIKALVSRHGEEQAKVVYQRVCPLVKASIGQHFRHSMDHLEMAALLAANPNNGAELHYDLRVRGGTLEKDMMAARDRIQHVANVLEDVATKTDGIARHPVEAFFMLAGTGDYEYGLASTVGRELGFAAHHAIHHLALVRLIATQSAGLTEDDLPSDFGRAPSTVVHDLSVVPDLAEEPEKPDTK